MNDEKIICTGGHPFYVLNAEEDRKVVECEGVKASGTGTWICAKELKVSDQVLLLDGSCAIIKEIQVEKLSEPETTYNFEVADYHTYYVSDSKVLVHNMCAANERGAVQGSEEEVVLKVGKELDRYGSLGAGGKGGRFVTDAGTPKSKLALPLENTGQLTRLKVIKEFKALKGIIAPHPIWGAGGGVQYYLNQSVADLIEQGFLAII